jgi:hypothetical protein
MVAAATVGPMQAPPGPVRTVRAALVRPAVWAASVLVMACAVGLARGGGDDSFGLLLSLVAPLLAVAGVAAVYGPEAIRRSRCWR